jgi:hypothetical protein
MQVYVSNVGALEIADGGCLRCRVYNIYLHSQRT